MKDLTKGRLLTVKQCNIVKVQSLLFFSAERLCAFADRLPGQSANYLSAHRSKECFYPEGRWARMFRSLYMYTA